MRRCIAVRYVGDMLEENEVLNGAQRIYEGAGKGPKE